jgi:hypothetical protein
LFKVGKSAIFIPAQAITSNEIDGLVKSIKNLQTNVFNTTRAIYTEATFKSRIRFEAGAFYEIKKSKWSAYIQLEQYDSKSSVFMSTKDFLAFLLLLEQAKLKM